MTVPQPDLVDRVRERLARDGRAATSATVADAVRREGGVMGDIAVHRLARSLKDELVGLGPLSDLVKEPRVTDVLVNGPQDVWVDRGAGLERASVTFSSVAEVRRLAVRLAAAAGRRLDDASPCVDVRIGPGIRLHAVLPPIAEHCTVLSLRIPRAQPFTLDDLAAAGAFGDQAAAWLDSVVRHRLAFLVTGGTGSGKTTLLAALLSLVPAKQRLVLVEDAAELHPVHPHVVRLESRPPNVEGAGEVSLRELVRHALRMRPDRLVVGEARGAEIIDLLAAMNTGHEGGCGTLHANGVSDVPARVAALAALGGLDRDGAMTQFGSAVDAVIHLKRGRDGRRRVAEIGAVVSDRAGTHVQPALTWSVDGSCTAGEGLPSLRSRIAEGSA